MGEKVGKSGWKRQARLGGPATGSGWGTGGWVRNEVQMHRPSAIRLGMEARAWAGPGAGTGTGWTESVAVGSREFVEEIGRGTGRRRLEIIAWDEDSPGSGRWMLKDTREDS